MVNRQNRSLAKKRNTRGRRLSGGSYYKYNDLRNATPRDFLLSERSGAVGPLKGGRRRRRTKRRSSKNRRGRRTRRGGSNIPRPRPSTAEQIRTMEINVANAAANNTARINRENTAANNAERERINAENLAANAASGVGAGGRRRRRTRRGRTRRGRTRRGGNKTRGRKSHSKRQRGGYSGSHTIIPQEIVNIGRSTVHDVGSFSNAFRGIADSASPLPTEDQLNSNAGYKFTYTPVSLPEIRADAEAKVGKL
jgi:hypothetical protein